MSKTFIGGIKPRYCDPLCDMPQERLCPKEIDLNIPDGYRITVSSKDAVAVGDAVAVSDCGLPSILSGLSGNVVSAENGKVIISSDGENRLSESCAPVTGNIKDISNDELTDKLLKMGVPLPKKGKKAPVCLVVGCVEPEDGSSSVHSTVRENAGELVGGCKILMRLIGVDRTVIAVSRSMRDCMRELSCFNGDGRMIKLVSVSDKYPGHLPHIIISSVFNLEITPKRDTSDAGYPFVTAEQCIAVFKALAEGIPYTHTAVTVSGEYESFCGNFIIPKGTEVKELISLASDEDIRPESIIFGGTVNGRVISEPHYITKDDCSVILTKKPRVKENTHSCISCGRCVSVCPIRLFPNQIYLAHIKDDRKAARTLAADYCINCGCCSYICPASLPLADSAQKEKAAIELESSETSSSEKGETNE